MSTILLSISRSTGLKFLVVLIDRGVDFWRQESIALCDVSLFDACVSNVDSDGFNYVVRTIRNNLI